KTGPPGEGGEGCMLDATARSKSGTARRGENANCEGARLAGQERTLHLPGAASELRATEMGQRELASPPDSLPG
ncbi:MAG: hypothetical protein ABJF95_08790, partial [Marinobacter sp.]|uniref:hypothetical protein n=1 Tax=Marinobacter sp. TaxID=50741 RepID=UPI00326491F0